MSTRKAVFPANPHALYKQHGYSPAVLSGDLLFVSGMVGARKDGTPEPDLKAQIQLAFDNLRDVLAAAGCTFDDVVDLTFFLIDPEASVGLVLEAMKMEHGLIAPFDGVVAELNAAAGAQVAVDTILARIAPTD